LGTVGGIVSCRVVSESLDVNVGADVLLEPSFKLGLELVSGGVGRDSSCSSRSTIGGQEDHLEETSIDGVDSESRYFEGTVGFSLNVLYLLHGLLMTNRDLWSLFNFNRDSKVIIVPSFSLSTLHVILLASSEVVPGGDGLLIRSPLVVPVISTGNSIVDEISCGEIGHVVLSIDIKLAPIVTSHVESVPRGDGRNKVTSESISHQISLKSIGGLEVHKQGVVMS
jgi:hypothetical protein